VKKGTIFLTVVVLLMATAIGSAQEFSQSAYPHFEVAYQWQEFINSTNRTIADMKIALQEKQSISNYKKRLEAKEKDLIALLMNVEKELSRWEKVLEDEPISVSRIRQVRKQFREESNLFRKKFDSLTQVAVSSVPLAANSLEKDLATYIPRENKSLVYDYDFYLFQQSPSNWQASYSEEVLKQRLLPEEEEEPCLETSLTYPSFNTVEELYYYLHDNFFYQPYFGLLKGPAEILRSKAGNDFDLAQLLVTLCREQGYSARYVYGRIKVPLSKIQNWLGIQELERICRILQWATKAPVEIVEEPEGEKVWFWHLWVEVNLDSEEWVPLDASFKQYSFYNPALPFLPFYPEQYWNNKPDQLPIEDYFTRWKKYLIQNSFPVESLAWKREILIDENLFPPPLPYEEYDVLLRTEKISRRNFHQVRLILPGIDVCFKTGELASEKIFLYYRQIPEDKKVVSKLGGILDCPSFLLSLQPILELGNRRIIGKPVSAGEVHFLEIHFLSPEDSPKVYRYPVKAGTYLAVFINLGTVPRQKVENIARRFGALTSDRIIQELIQKKGENYVGDLFYLTLLSYYHQLNAQISLLNTIFPITLIPLPSMAIMETDLKTLSVLSCPWRLKIGGINFQILRNAYALYPLTPEVPLDIFNSLCAWQGMALVEEIFMQMFYVDAISVIKLFRLAQQESLPLENFPGEISSLSQFPELNGELEDNSEELTVWGMAEELRYRNFSGKGYYWCNADASNFQFRLFCYRGSTAEISEGLFGLLAMIILNSLPTSERGPETAYHRFWSYWSSNERVPLLKPQEFINRYLQEAKKFINWNFELGYDPQRKIIDCAQLLEQAFIHASKIRLPLTVADGLANNYVLGGFLIPDIPIWIQIPFPYTKSATHLQTGDLTFYDLAPDDVDPPGDGNIEHSGIYYGDGYWLWASATIDVSGDGKPEVVYMHQDRPGKYTRQMRDMTEKIFMHRRWTYPGN